MCQQCAKYEHEMTMHQAMEDDYRREQKQKEEEERARIYRFRESRRNRYEEE